MDDGLEEGGGGDIGIGGGLGGTGGVSDEVNVALDSPDHDGGLSVDGSLDGTGKIRQ